MARIVELVLILNGLAGVAGYLGFKVRRAKQATKSGVNKAAGLIGVEVYNDELPDPSSFGGSYPYTPAEVQMGYGTQHDPRSTEHTPHFKPYDEKCSACNPKRSKLARFGDAIR